MPARSVDNHSGAEPKAGDADDLEHLATPPEAEDRRG